MLRPRGILAYLRARLPALSLSLSLLRLSGQDLLALFPPANTVFTDKGVFRVFSDARQSAQSVFNPTKGVTPLPPPHLPPPPIPPNPVDDSPHRDDQSAE